MQLIGWVINMSQSPEQKQKKRLGPVRRRALPVKHTKPKLVVVGEGLTEKSYFENLKAIYHNVAIVLLNNKRNSDPNYLLSLISKYEEDGNYYDFAAIVIDNDGRSDESIKNLFKWQKNRKNFLCISSPNIEYWFLCHFDCKRNISTTKECNEALAHLLPNYKKGKTPKEVLFEPNIRKAIEKAKTQVSSVYLTEIPQKGTNLYGVVEIILNNQGSPKKT